MGLFSRERGSEEAKSVAKTLVPRGERLMAWATGPDRLDGEQTLVVATDAALYAPGYLESVPWQSVLRAAWEEPVLEVVTLPEDGTTNVIRITLDEAGAVPQVVWERVNATIVMQRHVDLVGDRGVTFVARRLPDAEDIKWQSVFDAGLDPADEMLTQRATEELAYIRDSAGI